MASSRIVPSPARLAFSYVRFSTPQQAQGDSYRRQTAAAAAYADKHGLTLDPRNFDDLGVSAYKGRNADDGRLGVFLEMVRDGSIPSNSVLLVESLDRISRQTARRALRTLESIVDEGVEVVTLTDARKYTAQGLEEDPLALMSAILLFARANEESAIKGARVRAAWDSKRKRAASQPMTKVCPAWLRLNEERTGFDVVPERAAVVRRIFEMAADGVGQHTIAATLNAEGVPTFGDAVNRRRPAKHWQRSYIAKLLASPAPVGTFIPHGSTVEDGKRVRVPWEPVPDYFPAVVDPELARRAQLLAGPAGTNPRRGRHAAVPVRNVLAGLARCPVCEGTMTRVTKGSRAKAGKPYLVCVQAKAGAGCRYHAVPVQLVEVALRSRGDELVLKDAVEDLDPALQAMEDELRALAQEVDNLAEAIAQGGRSDALLRRLGEAEGRERTLRLDRDAKVTHREATREPLVERRLADLRAALGAEGELDAGRVNAALRLCAERVIVDYRSGQLYVLWRHGGVTDITFAFPEEAAA